MSAAVLLSAAGCAGPPERPTVTSTPPVGTGPAVASAIPSAAVGVPLTATPIPPRTAPSAPGRPASPAPGAAPTLPPTATPAAGFTATVAHIDDARADRMASSWHPGCPVPLSGLRHLTLTHRGMDGADHQGELVVAAAVADDVVAVFHRLYDDGFPIASMRLVDDFDGDDDASMAADNTSAFNCRPVTGGSGFSEHSYGTAVDVNPVENPYVRDGTVLPPGGRRFASRPDLPGVLHAGDAVVAAFADIGWTWGGSWSNPTDFQHFSLSGR